MAKIAWDQEGERLYETGTDRGVLYVRSGGTYGTGVPWNGLTGVSEAPDGAESNPQYADNIKYLDLTSAENFKATITAFTYPDEFEACDGSASPVAGVTLSGQERKSFGFSYRTKVGNDTDGEDAGYKIHLVYGAKAAPSQKDRKTINDSPEALEFSWEVSTTPASVAAHRPTAHITINSMTLDPAKLKALETKLYGDETNQPTLPTPDEVLTLVGV